MIFALVVPIMTARAPRTPELRIGCSGWSYKHWRGRFYPDVVRATKWLPYYAERFDTAEANSTFYRLPGADTFAAWAAQTPRDFVMAVKASRYLTHLKRLRDPAEPLQRLLERAAALGARLGPVLYQLPGHFHADRARLADFLAALPASLVVTGQARPLRLKHVIEFRHSSWYTDDTFA